MEFRKENQRVEDRREYDLNDPDFKLKDVPARVSDADPRLTVSGMQKFDGEDLEYERRKNLQQKQLRYRYIELHALQLPKAFFIECHLAGDWYISVPRVNFGREKKLSPPHSIVVGPGYI